SHARPAHRSVHHDDVLVGDLPDVGHLDLERAGPLRGNHDAAVVPQAERVGGDEVAELVVDPQFQTGVAVAADADAGGFLTPEGDGVRDGVPTRRGINLDDLAGHLA